MKQAQQVASPNTLTSSTYFGPLRIKRAVGATTTRYLYSGSKPIAEYVNGSTTPSKEYIYAGSTLLATVAGTSTTYHHPDHLSNRAETDATGAVVRTAGHFPYGESWYESSSDPMKFTSYARDSATGESGLDYAMFRQFNPGQGRFMSADLLAGSLAAPQSLNRYSYAGSNPINLKDPLGLEPILCAPGMTYNGDGSGYCVPDPEGQGKADPNLAPDKSGGGPTINIPNLRERLWKALMSDPDCLAFLGINGAVSILSLVDEIPIDVDTYFDRDLGAITTAEQSLESYTVQNPSIHINSNGPFFPGKGLTAEGPRGSAQVQATIMFHELAHASNAIPNDRATDKQSQNNTKTVKQKCKKAISTFAGK